MTLNFIPKKLSHAELLRSMSMEQAPTMLEILAECVDLTEENIDLNHQITRLQEDKAVMLLNEQHCSDLHVKIDLLERQLNATLEVLSDTDNTMIQQALLIAKLTKKLDKNKKG